MTTGPLDSEELDSGRLGLKGKVLYRAQAKNEDELTWAGGEQT